MTARVLPIALSALLCLSPLVACSQSDDDADGGSTRVDSSVAQDALGGDTSGPDAPEPGDLAQPNDTAVDVPDVADPDTPDAPLDVGVDGQDAGDGLSDLLGDGNDPDLPPDVPDVPDVAPDLGPQPDVEPDPSLCSPAGGTFNIYDIQDPNCPDHPIPEPSAPAGIELTLSGVVVSAVFGDTIFVQEPPGGPYSGIAVYFHGVPTGSLSVGDVLDITGNYGEFYELSQVYLIEYTTVSSGGPEPVPYLIEDPLWVATNGPLAEMFEGVLIRVENVKTTHTWPDCPHDFGEFEVAGRLRIDDMGIAWDARLDDDFTAITGPLNYSFGNYKMEPRDHDDLDVNMPGGGTALSKCIALECTAPDAELGTHEVIINEVMVDPYGSDGGKEWFELHNPGNQPVTLTGWSVRDCGDQVLPPLFGGSVIPPKGYLVVGAQSDFSLNGGVPVSIAYGEAFYLPNTVGSILLYDGDNKLVDQMRYSAFEEWVPVFFAGSSLERVSVSSDGTKVEAWAPGSDTWGETENRGTPGARNDAATD